MLTPEAQAQVDARQAQLRDRARAGVPVNPAPVPGARAFTLDQVAVGWRVHSARRKHAGDDLEIAAPLGGIVVEVIHDRGIDPETGEMWDRTRYRCLDPHAPPGDEYHAWVTLGAEEVDLGQLVGIDRAGIARCLEWLGFAIKGRTITATEARHVFAAKVLAEAAL